MDRFAQFAYSTILRDASFVALAAATLMVGFSFNPPLALVIGAHIALIFSLILLYRVTILTEAHVRRSEAWRGLEPHERPRGDFALAIARERLEEAAALLQNVGRRRLHPPGIVARRLVELSRGVWVHWIVTASSRVPG